jgi:hypothetical protein
MLERVRCRIEKCVKFSDLYRSQKSEILYDSQKAYRATNEVVFNSVTIQLLHTILLSKQNERADALLRQKQNVSMNLSDDRVQHCMMQIIHSEMISKPIQAASMTVADISSLCYTRSELV